MFAKEGINILPCVIDTEDSALSTSDLHSGQECTSFASSLLLSLPWCSCGLTHLFFSNVLFLSYWWARFPHCVPLRGKYNLKNVAEMNRKTKQETGMKHTSK